MDRKIYLTPLPASNFLLREKMIKIINRAGMKVLNHEESSLTNNDPELIRESDIILSLITNEVLDKENKNVFREIEALNNYKDAINQKPIIVWCSKELIGLLREKGELKTIESLKRLVSNQHFISYPSLIKLVDDLRSFKLKKEERKNEKLYDITFICNENDKKNSENILLLISDILKINPIYIDFSQQADYAAVCSESILNSNLCVVYSNDSKEWAVNFSQQVWKIIGGVSSKIPILTIFDKANTTPDQVVLEVPNIFKVFTEDTLAGLEIKMFYEKITMN